MDKKKYMKLQQVFEKAIDGGWDRIEELRPFWGDQIDYLKNERV